MARIALDIDSTLHHYWDLLERIAAERFGVTLRYEDQHRWGIATLDPDQVLACVQETHSEANILGAAPYPGAVETVRSWHERGHWIHVTSHRAVTTREATERWLAQIGLPYDDLHCSWDKIPRCVELGVDLLVDDSPVNIEAALAEGLLVATLAHPWNRVFEGRSGVVVGVDWAELGSRLAPLLAAP